MAIYHLQVKAMQRSAGKSVTAAAAYRSGSRIVDERSDKEYDYTRKKGVLHAELVLPGGGTVDRSAFWNDVEKHHKRGDAVLSREVEVSLPTELTPEQRQTLAINYAKSLADKYGVAADVCIHAPRKLTDKDFKFKGDRYFEIDEETGDMHNGNWHAHIMLSACYVSADGTLGKKAVELDPIHCNRHKMENMVEVERERWSQIVNHALESYVHTAKVDHRSLKDQGIDRVPTQHIGAAGIAYENRTGKKSARRKSIELQIEREQQRREKEKADAETDQLNANAQFPVELDSAFNPDDEVVFAGTEEKSSDSEDDHDDSDRPK